MCLLPRVKDTGSSVSFMMRSTSRMPVEGMTNFIVRFRGLSAFSRRRARR